MREFKKRRTSRGELLNFYLRLGGALVLLLITLAAVKAAWDMYGRLRIASLGRAQAQAQLQNLETQEAGVSASVKELSTPRGQEALMREHYGVAKPGEGVIQIVTNASSTPPAPPRENWFLQVFHALFSW